MWKLQWKRFSGNNTRKYFGVKIMKAQIIYLTALGVDVNLSEPLDGDHSVYCLGVVTWTDNSLFSLIYSAMNIWVYYVFTVMPTVLCLCPFYSVVSLLFFNFCLPSFFFSVSSSLLFLWFSSSLSLSLSHCPFSFSYPFICCSFKFKKIV